MGDSIPRLFGFYLAVPLFLFAFVLGSARAKDTLTSTLVLAIRENHSGKAESDLHLRPYIKDIFSAFHYERLSLVGRKSRVIWEHSKGILKPNQVFYSRYAVLKRLRAHYHMHFDLIENSDTGEKLLATIEVLLAKGAPLYVKGPLWHSGRLILILEIDKE